MYKFTTIVLISGLICLSATGKQKPNVLMICIDDMNDWCGFLNGHPQSKTPNMDKLAKRGVNFTNANLMEANFTDSNINDAKFEGANLNKAIWTDGKICAAESIGICK